MEQMEQTNAGATGALIAQRRREKGWSQAELAERIHVTDKAVSKWETGRSLPGIDCLELLAEALDLQVLELLRGRRLPPEAPAEARAEVREVLAYSRREVRRRTRSQRRRCLAALLALLLAAGLGLWRRGWDSGGAAFSHCGTAAPPRRGTPSSGSTTGRRAAFPRVKPCPSNSGRSATGAPVCG